MHPEVKRDKPGRCPTCGMSLVSKEERHEKDELASDSLGHISGKSYTPLLTIVLLLFLASIATSYPSFDMKEVIHSFMIGFFLVFGGFKLIDLKGFAEGYATYDLLARRWYTYGYVYPFIEVLFGISMMLGIFTKQILVAEIIVMGFSGIGVLLKLLKGEKIQCVCLGTFLKIPLTKITLVEDFGMVVLALASLCYIFLT